MQREQVPTNTTRLQSSYLFNRPEPIVCGFYWTDGGESRDELRWSIGYSYRKSIHRFGPFEIIPVLQYELRKRSPINSLILLSTNRKYELNEKDTTALAHFKHVDSSSFLEVFSHLQESLVGWPGRGKCFRTGLIVESNRQRPARTSWFIGAARV